VTNTKGKVLERQEKIKMVYKVAVCTTGSIMDDYE
jgi:hypothetical protein